MLEDDDNFTETGNEYLTKNNPKGRTSLDSKMLEKDNLLKPLASTINF